MSTKITQNKIKRLQIRDNVEIKKKLRYRYTEINFCTTLNSLFVQQDMKEFQLTAASHLNSTFL